MAVNDLTTVMFVVQLIVLCFTLVSATSNNAPYEVLDGARLTRVASVDVRLDTHERFRRQVSGSNDDNGPPSPDASGQANVTESTTMKPTTTTSTTTKQTSTKTTTTAKDPFVEADVIHDFHDYYNSDVYKDKSLEHWVELENAPRHETLSTSHRVAAVISLKFPFHFYGHEIQNVTVATGGFIYISPFLHQWLTATQYIAPLMANFDPSLSEDSNIYYESTTERFIVEWKDLMLKDQNSTGKFHFQTILRRDDSITFVYKKVPYAVGAISTSEHPVKVGLSDAYYNDTYVPEYKIKRRTIYEYHKVALEMAAIKSGSVVVLTPLKTCNRLSSCDTCVKHEDVKFDCRWCNTIGRCSDGLDWYRQHWDKQGCKSTSVDSLSGCPSWVEPTTAASTTTNKALTTTQMSTPKPMITASTSPITTTPVPAGSMPGGRSGGCANTSNSEVCSSLPTPPKPIVDPLQPSQITDNDKCKNGKCNKDNDFPVAVVVVVILLIVGLLAAVGGWVFYAYTHPTSRSGMWLMEHRPSQIKAKIKFWKNNTDSSAKYKAESEA